MGTWVISYDVETTGVNIFKLIKSLRITGAVAASVKEFLIQKCTGEFVMTEDSAYATLLYDTRKGKRGFSKEICSMLGMGKKSFSTG